MSDRKRHEWEIQRVGTDAAASGDITFRALSNYKDFQGGKAGGVATHGVVTGELSLAVIVPSQKASDYSHAYEQAAGRPNMEPKVFTTDICPKGIDLWKDLYGPAIKCNLGMFHFLNRITRTLRKDHVDYKAACKALSIHIIRISTRFKSNNAKKEKAPNALGNSKTSS